MNFYIAANIFNKKKISKINRLYQIWLDTCLTAQNSGTTSYEAKYTSKTYVRFCILNTRLNFSFELLWSKFIDIARRTIYRSIRMSTIRLFSLMRNGSY